MIHVHMDSLKTNSDEIKAYINIVRELPISYIYIWSDILKCIVGNFLCFNQTSTNYDDISKTTV